MKKNEAVHKTSRTMKTIMLEGVVDLFQIF